MTDTTTVTHRLKPGSWPYKQYGSLEGTVERLPNAHHWQPLTFHTAEGHAFDVYSQEIEEVS